MVSESLRDHFAGCDIKNESLAKFTWPVLYIDKRGDKKEMTSGEQTESNPVDMSPCCTDNFKGDLPALTFFSPLHCVMSFIVHVKGLES